MSINKALMKAAYEVCKKSYTPFAQQPLGAAVLTKFGNIYTGCIVENAAHPNTTCAIRNAAVNALSSDFVNDGSVDSTDFIVSCALAGCTEGEYADPCGGCRQMLLEFGNATVYLLKCVADASAVDEFDYKTTTVLELLPFAKYIKPEKSIRWKPTFAITKITSSDGSEPPANMKLLIEGAIEATRHSYIAYSDFPVGAALQTDIGIVLGSNVECNSFQLTLCAERTAIAKAIAAGTRSFKALAVLCAKLTKEFGTPCGGCRQSIVEFVDDKFPVYCLQYLGDGHWYYENTTAYNLLPFAFTPMKLNAAN